MAYKDLTEYLTPDLELPYEGKTYVVAPPDKDTGLKLSAVTAVGVSAFGDADAIDRLSDGQRKLYESIRDVDLGVLSLGATYDEMVQDKVPGPHLDTFALYAAFYWTMGERIADQVIAARKSGGADPKATARPRSKSGRSTASGSRKSGSTASRSTPTTGSQKAQPGGSFKKADTSDGQTS